MIRFDRLNRLPWRRRMAAWDCLVALLGAVGGTLAAIVAVRTAGIFLKSAAGIDWSPGRLQAQALTVAAPLAGALAVCYLVPASGGLLRKLGVRTLRCRDLWLVAAGCLAIWFVGNFLIGESWRLLLDFLGVDYVPTQALANLAMALSGWRLAALIFLVAVMTPVAEELLFRRLLFGLFRPLGGLFALCATSVIFGCVHFFLLGLPQLIFMGVVFQLSYLCSRNLLVPILIHMVINGTVFLMIPAGM